MNIVGPPLGKTALIPAGFSEANINQAIAIYRIEDLLLREYFFEYLRSTFAQNWLARGSKKTSGQQNLTLQLAQELPVPIPPRSRMEVAIATAQSFKKVQAEILISRSALSYFSTALTNQVFGA